MNQSVSWNVRRDFNIAKQFLVVPVSKAKRANGPLPLLVVTTNGWWRKV